MREGRLPPVVPLHDPIPHTQVLGDQRLNVSESLYRTPKCVVWRYRCGINKRTFCCPAAYTRSPAPLHSMLKVVAPKGRSVGEK